MSNDQKAQKKTMFGGIFDGITKVIMKEEYLQQIHEESEAEEPASNNVTPPLKSGSGAIQTPPPIPQQSGSDVEAMIKKIYAAFEAMNQPGIDFLELWNSVEAMGGVTEQNFIQAYKVLNIGAGNSLTVDGIVDSGKHYIAELKKQIEGGIIQKKNDRQKLVDQQQNEKVSLTVETNALAKQIQDLQKELIDKQQKLAQVDSTYTTPIAAIDQKINVANAALEQVLNQLQGAVDLFSKIKLS